MGGAFLFGWAYAGVTVQSAMLTRTVFGPKDYARIYSNISIALAAGGALASGGWGLLADATSPSGLLYSEYALWPEQPHLWAMPRDCLKTSPKF